MRLSLTVTPTLTSQLALEASPDAPPLAFIDDEPFLLELQGSLDPPKGEDPALELGMEGVRVGKLDLDNPKKPVMRIAHHRLEGKIEKLATPYALLRTQPESAPDSEAATTNKASHSAVREGDRPTKRARTRSPSPDPSTLQTSQVASPPNRIEIVALIRHKIIFSRRPEPLIDVSSEADPTFAERKGAAPAESRAGAEAAKAAAGSAEGPEKSKPAKDKTGLGKAASFFAPRKPAAKPPA
ncbi:hypothetical protein JCM8202_000472 [Rhodotorula sphaerocarpa]